MTNDGKTLVLHVVGCSDPQFRGKEIDKQISLANDQLSYGNPNPSVGGSAVLVWHRTQ